jgi:type II secretory pathway pseudopilin PulG
VFLKFLFQRRRYFTIIELLVVIAIMAVLMSILLPAITAVRRAALKSVSSSNLRQIAIAITDRDTQLGKNLPVGDPTTTPPRFNVGALMSASAPVANTYTYYSIHPQKGAVEGGLFYVILPYLEEDGLFNTAVSKVINITNYSLYYFHGYPYGRSGGYTSYNYFNAGRGTGDVKVYEGPADPTWRPGDGLISYVANKLLFCANPQKYQAINPKTGQPVSGYNASYTQYGPLAQRLYNGYNLGTIPDGTTNTLMLAEAYAGNYGYCDSYSVVSTNRYPGYSYTGHPGNPNTVHSVKSYPGSMHKNRAGSMSLSVEVITIRSARSSVAKGISRTNRWNLSQYASGYSYHYTTPSSKYPTPPGYSYTGYKTPYSWPNGMYVYPPSKQVWVEEKYGPPYSDKYSDVNGQTGPVFDDVPGKFQTWPITAIPYHYSYQPLTTSASWHKVTVSTSTYHYTYWQGHGPYRYSEQSSGQCSASMPQANFAGGLLISMADASVHTVSNGVSQSSWDAAMHPADNKVPGSDW